MSPAASIIARALSAGLALKVEGNSLRVAGPRDALTDELKKAIKLHKSEIVGLCKNEVSLVSSVSYFQSGQEFCGGSAKIGMQQIEAWRAAIEAVPEPCNHDGERLLKASLTFLASENAALLFFYGWDEIALFGIHKGIAPRARIDAWGLVTTIAWSTFSLTIKEGCRWPLCSHVTERTGRLSAHIQAGDKAGLANAAPWWRHPALIGDVS